MGLNLRGTETMAFINKKTDKKSVKDRFAKKDRFNKPEENDDEDDKLSSTKKKFDNKPAPSDEDDDDNRNLKFKKKDNDKFNKDDDDDDEDEKKKGVGSQNVTKDLDQDTDDTESTSVDKKRGDEDEDDEDDDDSEKKVGSKDGGGKCNCGRQIEINPPIRTQYEAIEALPLSLQADAIAALATQLSEKILSSLHEKAEEHGVDFDILFEVFRRGWFSGRGSDHLTEDEIAFNRVNSFLAGGLARRLDRDLVEDMGINTPSDNMVCDHDEPTPGEKLKSRLRKKRK